MKRIDEIRARRGVISDELLKLEQVEDETDETVLRFEALTDEWDTLADELKPLEEREQRMAAVRSAMEQESNREKSFGAPDLVKRTASNPFRDFNYRALGDGSRESQDEVFVPESEIRSRALSAVEWAAKHEHVLPSDHAENATALIERSDHRLARGVARHILHTGSPEYLKAFESFVRNPVAGEHAMRAALSLTGANGGFLVPFTLDPTIILTNVGSKNPYRQIAEIKQTTTNTWNGVTSAGVNAAWLAEGTEAADSSPTVGQLAITPAKASAWLFGSYEVLQDSDFASQLPMLLSDAKDRLEEAAFATGTGSGQPKGIVTAATTTVTTAGAGVVALADLFSLQAAVPPRWRGGVSRNAWVMSLALINKARGFDTAGGSSYWTNLGLGSPETLLGAPVYESTTISSAITTTTSKVAVVGDFSQFLIVDRVGMEVLYEPIVKGASQRATGQGGWFAFWRVGSDVTTPAAFRTLVVQ